MLTNYIKVALRHLRRQPLYTSLNMLGLTMGLAASLLILLYLGQELSYDQYHSKGERIYRVSADIKEPDDAFRWAVTQLPLAKELKAQFAEVEQYTRFIDAGRTRFQREGQDNSFFQEQVYFVDSTVFDVFSFEIIQGDVQQALERPNSIVLSESAAKAMFGEENPIGQTIKTDNFTLQVTATYADMPQNSHIVASAMISTNSNERFNRADGWGGFGIYTYVLLRAGTDPAAFEAKLQGIIDQHVNPIFEPIGITVTYETINIRDIHLTSDFEGEPEALGNMEYIYIFSLVGIFLLLIACINYMNMATARAIDRSLEVGMRKVMGAVKGALVGQFLVESIIITLFAAVLSLGLLYVSVPLFNSLFDLNLSVSSLWQPQLLMIFFGILFFTAMLGGSYPVSYTHLTLPTICSG